MLKECDFIKAFTLKRNINIMYGLTLCVCLFVYILGLLVLSSASPRDSVYRSRIPNSVALDVDENHDNRPLGTYDMPGSMISNNVYNQRNVENPDKNVDNIYLDDDTSLKFESKSGSHPHRNRTKRLPNAIIIGVKKAGTRALLEYLRLHPDVKAPGPEPHFFDKYYHKGLKWYRERMPETIKGQLTVEKTPSYFVTKAVPEKVYKMSKKTKLIVVFRDPVTRAISDYAQLASRNPNVKSFEEMVYVNNKTKIIDTSWTIVKIGIYAQHLARWLEYFPIRQIHFVSAENLIKDPVYEMKRIQEFLGLEQYITADNFTFNQTKGFPCYRRDVNAKTWHCLNEEKGRRHPGINTDVIRRLEDFYRPFNQKLYSMTGTNFKWS